MTEISYAIVAAKTLPGYEFLGLVSLGMDISSYYSFIHQAAEGHWLFRNNMTHLDCDRAFFNLQWLIVGKCMGWFAWTPQFTFKVWRFAGAIVLMLGFAPLVVVVLPKMWQRVTAMMMFAFGGGFGWVLAILGTIGIVDTRNSFGLRNPAIDLITAIHPFAQVLKNPHYSLPHGIFLLFITLYIRGEQTKRARWYIAAAIVANVQGLMRPYDLITICAVLPAFVAVELLRTWNMTPRVAFLRLLPAMASLPQFGYYYYIFSIHPVFKYWASQGDQPPTSIFWYTLGLGLAGILFIWRLLRSRHEPFATSTERFFVVMAIVIFGLFHGNHLKFLGTKLFSFSPQVGIPILAPLILIGIGMLPVAAELLRLIRPKRKLIALAAFLIVNAFGSALYVTWNANLGTIIPRNFLRTSDVEAMSWLKGHVKPDDLVLSSEAFGSRISYLMSVRVALGHWALTPDVKTLDKRFARFVEGDMPRGKAEEFIDEIRPKFIYVGNALDAEDPAYFRKIARATLVFSNGDVAIYEITPSNKTILEREIASTP
ncbi:MAG: hypothetical protein IT367_02095 [Candidatus Hydrogenedentes bacterium]|nr:hypothetical protein [Candidatus Hydrogenedentota bacterium]